MELQTFASIFCTDGRTKKGADVFLLLVRAVEGVQAGREQAALAQAAGRDGHEDVQA